MVSRRMSDHATQDDAATRLMIVGGFLGAGKTTSLGALAALLAARGERVAVVTNDQAAGLVDTRFLAARGLPTGEVAGACFCCDLPSLRREVARLIDETGATTILAEPVGSCTDLVATVVRPLERAMGTALRVLPLSVLVDAERLGAAGADPSIDWLVKQQLDEADIVVVTKRDRLDDAARARVVEQLEHVLPGRSVLTISAGDPDSLAAWHAHAMQQRPQHRWLRDLDYARYAAAEAELAWLNAAIDVDFAAPAPAVDVVRAIVAAMRDAIGAQGGVIGNLKAWATTAGGAAIRAGTAAVWSPVEVDATATTATTHSLRLVVNARATVAPDDLASMLDDAVRAAGARTRSDARAAFRPRPPVPSERVVDEVAS